MDWCRGVGAAELVGDVMVGGLDGSGTSSVGTMYYTTAGLKRSRTYFLLSIELMSLGRNIHAW